MLHYPGHAIMGVAAFAATLAIIRFTVNRLVQRKLRLSLYLLGAYALLHVIFAIRPELTQPGAMPITDEDLRSLEGLVFSAAVINLLVVALVNPLRVDRVPDRFPAIVQDAIVIGLLVLVSTFVFDDKLLTTSAVSAVVVGFALQDTLGNAFAGLALQSEKPFHVGDWVRVGDFEGRVAEVTWRATKLRTKAGNFVVVPNNIVAKEAITNYSEPALPTRTEIEAGASYLAAPNDVKAAILEAIANAPRVLKTPAPDVVLVSFDASAITYRARFWIEDFERDEMARDQVRTAIYYAFARHNIEIPWPIQVDYHRDWPAADPAQRARELEQVLAGVDIFAGLGEEPRREIAASATVRTYGAGEAIVRQGEPGQSMYVIASGSASVVLEDPGSVRLPPSHEASADRRSLGGGGHPDHKPREIATIEKGGYFGEMSLLTGEPRSATVLAQRDTVVIEISADLFRRLGSDNPVAVEQIGVAAMARRVELEAARAAAPGSMVAEAPATFLSRMKRFLRLS